MRRARSSILLLSAWLVGCAAGEMIAPIPDDVAAASADVMRGGDAGTDRDSAALGDAPGAVIDASTSPTDAQTPPRDSAPGDAASSSDVALCPMGQVPCDGVCTVLSLDPRHCGGCGVACSPAERCDDGVCRIVCPSGQQLCVAGGAASCATLATDTSHCGACGNACAAGQLCSAGRCASVCSSGETLCAGADSTSCADLQRDSANCGGCGRRCGGAERCELGRCVSRCAAPEVACGDACVNLSASDANCGACGRRCGDGHTCIAGVCRPRCVAPAVLCGDSCDDVTSSARNCGACGAACPAGQRCSLGRCEIVCPSGQVVCNGRCVDLASDRANCGVCGRACASGVVCLRGVCTASCTGGLVSCGGACVDTRYSVQHCGVCNNSCAPRAGSTASCDAGRCRWSCNTGAGDCDGDASNGCETSLSSTSHCGACGNVCRVTGSGVARCSSRTCAVTCSSGTANCDGNYANGCEVDTRTSSAHCGACNRPCASGSTCVSGVCTAQTSVIESFDSTTWPRSPWVAVSGGSAGTRSTSCAHDGAAGVQDPGWIYRTDQTVGSSGQRLSAWVRRGGSGRAYLGFGASSGGGWSLVAGFNTNALLFQQNSNWGYTTLTEASFSSSVGSWYRVEVTFGSGGAVTGRIYSATGSTLATVSTTISGLPRGGVALRAFGTTCVDTIERR